MARKKTKIIVEEPTQVLGGNVKIKKVVGKRVVEEQTIHNVGTLQLFWGMLLSLGGTPDKNFLPSFIGAGTGFITPGSGVNPQFLTGLISEVSGARSRIVSNYKGPYTDINGPKAIAVYQCIVPYAMIGNASIREVGLFGDSDGNTLLARIELPADAPLTLQTGETYIFEWTFSISNATA